MRSRQSKGGFLTLVEGLLILTVVCILVGIFVTVCR
jgi:competence protein ComGC